MGVLSVDIHNIYSQYLLETMQLILIWQNVIYNATPPAITWYEIWTHLLDSGVDAIPKAIVCKVTRGPRVELFSLDIFFSPLTRDQHILLADQKRLYRNSDPVES